MNKVSFLKKLLALTGFFVASAALAETALFEVTNKKGESIYLGGTIHLLRPSDFPLPVEYQQAFDKSQSLVLETDLQIATLPENVQKMMQVMSYSGGKNLSTELSPKVWKQLQDYSAANQVPIGQIMQFKPVMVSMAMTMQKGQKIGLTPGVDAYFNQQARTQNKSLGELESFEDSLAFLDELNQIDANAVIQSTLRDLDKMEEMMLSVTSAWKKGDLTPIEKDMALPMKKEFPELYRIMVDDRNNKWIPKIEAMFATPEKEIVLVGSLHLVGEEGLLKQLKAKGYKIKAVQAVN